MFLSSVLMMSQDVYSWPNFIAVGLDVGARRDTAKFCDIVLWECFLCCILRVATPKTFLQMF